MNEIIDFINSRFPEDNDNWLSNNSYYFARILTARFSGKIIYNYKEEHFYANIDGFLWDWSGNCGEMDENCVYWSTYYEKSIPDFAAAVERYIV